MIGNRINSRIGATSANSTSDVRERSMGPIRAMRSTSGGEMDLAHPGHQRSARTASWAALVRTYSHTVR
jgi:hypothetical protein